MHPTANAAHPLANLLHTQAPFKFAEALQSVALSSYRTLFQLLIEVFAGNFSVKYSMEKQISELH
jgi:hypothetical protein